MALYKRATMSKSLSQLFKKERPWTKWFCNSLKKSDVSDSLLIQALKNRVICTKNFVFFVYFSLLFPFYAQDRIAPVALCSVALYKRVTVSDSLFFKSELLFCSQKVSVSIEKPMSEFPTLIYSIVYRPDVLASACVLALGSNYGHYTLRNIHRKRWQFSFFLNFFKTIVY